MAEYLIQKGMITDKIVIDSKCNNTKLTASNFIEKLEKNKSVIVVSQFHHISGAKLAFKNYGITKVYGVHCDYFELRDSCFREFFEYCKYLIFK